MSRIYDLLARVYDTPDHLEVTHAFDAAVRPFVQARPRGSWVLDVACGTGVLAERLGRARVPVVGVDGSKAMLAIARRRCRGLGGRVRFRRADLARFQVRESCSVATASGDVFNHMLTRGPLVRCLRQVGRNLQPGGLLIFDALNRFCYEQYWDGHDYFMEGEGGDIAMTCEWDGAKRLATVRMVGYAKAGRGRYEKFETTLVERNHTDAEFREALQAAGFERIRRTPWSPWSDQHLEPALDRNLWTATVPA
ncbi:MAG: methyltransferase domain-containing protein [Myxococcota bacterium]